MIQDSSSPVTYDNNGAPYIEVKGQFTGNIERIVQIYEGEEGNIPSVFQESLGTDSSGFSVYTKNVPVFTNYIQEGPYLDGFNIVTEKLQRYADPSLGSGWRSLGYELVTADLNGSVNEAYPVQSLDEIEIAVGEDINEDGFTGGYGYSGGYEGPSSGGSASEGSDGVYDSSNDPTNHNPVDGTYTSPDGQFPSFPDYSGGSTPSGSGDSNSSGGTGDSTSSGDSNSSGGTGDSTSSGDSNSSGGTGDSTSSGDSNSSGGTGDSTSSGDSNSSGGISSESGGLGGTPSTGGGSSGGGGSSSSPAATASTAPASTTIATTSVTPPAETPASLPSVPVSPTASPESPVLGIQPQATVTTVQLTTPLTLGNLLVTQAVLGTTAPDDITGSDQGEALAGGQGKDRMSGGGGADAFIFETPGEFGKKNADVITDFNPDEGDKVAIASEAFDGVTKIKFATVTGKKEAKRMGSTNKNFIYDNKKGTLYYDANGTKSGFGADGGEFAQLLGAPDIGKSDFVIC